MALIGINLHLWVFVYDCEFLMAIWGVYWHSWVFDVNDVSPLVIMIILMAIKGFLLEIMGFYWELWVFISDYVFISAIMAVKLTS